MQKLKGPENFKGVRASKLVKDSPEKIIEKIQKNYERVPKGKKPTSINQKDWKRYLNLHGIRHVCG